MSTIHLYAEHLQNIHTVSFTAILASYHTEQTRAELSADGEFITLTHEGEVASIRLPTRIKGGGSAALTLPSSPAKELTLRLQLEEKDGMRLMQDIFTYDRENVVPWNASEIGSWSGVSCRSCKTVLVGVEGARGEGQNAQEAAQNAITSWKDLPNEHWAEMMDFWHCHKPEHHHHHQTQGRSRETKEPEGPKDDPVATKGYAAGNKLTSRKGTGYVGSGFFLFAEDDCPGIEICPSAQDKHLLRCKKCSVTLGNVEDQARGWRVWKWCVFSPVAADISQVTGDNLECWISAHFLDLVENQGVRKYNVSSDDTSTNDSVILWIFTPSVLFSSSIQPPSSDRRRVDPTRAMKVFWREAEDASESKSSSAETTQQGVPLTQEAMSIEDVKLPSRLYLELCQSLKQNSNLMPPKARVFQDWNVSLLQRFARVAGATENVDITSALFE